MKSPEMPPRLSWGNYSEPTEVERLTKANVENVKFSFDIPNELSVDNKKIEAKISWLKLSSPDYKEIEGVDELASIEGKLYEPIEGENNNNEIIIFTPGFPGGNAGRFEKIYAQAFIDAGYSFFTIRHNGTSLTNGEVSADIINSDKRLDIEKKVGEHHLGGTKPEGYRPDQMVNEPITALLSLQKKYKKIHLMGQSMGVASSYNAVTKLGDNKEIMEKLGNIVGIAGYVGSEEGMPDGIWHGTKDFRGNGKYPDGTDGLIAYELDYVKQVDLNFTLTADEFRQSLMKVGHINGQMKVPDHVGNILVFTPEDPLIAGPKKTEEDIYNYGPKTNRKLIIEDETGLGKAKPHSMLWIKPENLVRAVEAKVSSHGPHYFEVKKSN